MHFADTSALFALLDRDHPQHGQVQAWIRSADREIRLLSTNYVITELVALLDRKVGRRAVRAFRSSVQPVLGLHWVSAAEHDLALARHVQASRRSSFVDQTSFLVMREAGIDTAFTLDGDFAAEGFATVP
jgi:predicted nucleic acid-binding protein